MPTADREATRFWAVLVTGLAANALLRSQAAYGLRAGFWAAFLSVPVLALAGWLFAVCWRRCANPFFSVLFTALLALCAVRELLQMEALLGKIYPGSLPPFGVWVLLLLPVAYLRRPAALSQTGRVLLWLLAVGGALLLLTVLPRLRLTNLQLTPLLGGELRDALRGQLVLYPEYLLPALFLPEQAATT